MNKNMWNIAMKSQILTQILPPPSSVTVFGFQIFLYQLMIRHHPDVILAQTSFISCNFHYVCLSINNPSHCSPVPFQALRPIIDIVSKSMWKSSCLSRISAVFSSSCAPNCIVIISIYLAFRAKCWLYKPVGIQSGGKRMFPPDSCFRNDTRKPIIRCVYVHIFNIVWCDQDFVDPHVWSTEILLRRASSIKMYNLIYRLRNFFVLLIKAK